MDLVVSESDAFDGARDSAGVVDDDIDSAADTGVGVDVEMPCPTPPAIEQAQIGPTLVVDTTDTATITAVDAGGLDLLLSSGTRSRLLWDGPALPFRVGDQVQLQLVSGPWWVLRSQVATAAVWNTGAPGMVPSPPPLPGGPSFALYPQCYFALPHATLCCVPDHATVYSIAATFEGVTARAGLGETITVGDWSVTNVRNVTGGACEADGCVADYAGFWCITVLGPGSTAAVDP
jgi:hypothetical protein